MRRSFRGRCRNSNANQKHSSRRAHTRKIAAALTLHHYRYIGWVKRLPAWGNTATGPWLSQGMLAKIAEDTKLFLSCTHHATCGEPLASLEGCWKTHAWGSVGGWICWDSIECLTMLEFWHTHLHTRQNRKVTHQTHSHQLKRSLKRLFLEKEHFLSAFNHCMTARLWIISVKSEVPLNPTEYKQNKSTTPCRWMGSRQLPNYADSNTTLVEFESWDIRLMFSLSWWCNRHTSDCEDQSDLQKSLLMKKTTD